MTATVVLFRGSYPAFIDPIKYTDSVIQMYLNLGIQMLKPDRWGAQLDYGVQLFTAHFMSLQAQAVGPGSNGVPGSVVGILSGASVDKVSYQRDVASVMEKDAGHWNMTSYGLVFIHMARMMGMGPVQVGAGQSSSGWPQSASAWPGPIFGPW